MTKQDSLHQAVQERYAKESAAACTLGCGSVLPHLDARPGESILDLGCGRGTDTLSVARQVAPEGQAVGLDLTEAMVRAAVEAAREAGAANAVFVTGDIEALPFEDNRFDGIISNCVLNHARDKAAAYREIHRVLKPGGRFVVADAVTRIPLPAEVREDPEAWAQCYGGAVTEGEYLDAVARAGFQGLEILARRAYIKNGHDFISITIKAVK